ncbi:MAG: DUF1254 domain-containing protein [Syntrophobacteraceae bacterium]
MTANIRSYTRRAKRWVLAVIVVALLASAGGWWALREGRPWLYGLQAYIYGFPLIMMDLTKQVSTAVPTAGEFTAHVNQFSVMTKYPDASFRAVVRTGLDTLFAVAWADLEKEPLVLSVPDTNGRYYVIALFDMWSNVFASIGKRTTGTGTANFLIAGPGWQGTPPADVKQTFRSPTRFVWVNGQMQANGRQDYAVVNALQKQYKLTPLSAWGRPYVSPADVPVAASVDTKTPPLEQVQKMDAGAYFGRLGRLMKDNPPAPADGPMVEKLKTIGIEPGKDFDIAKIDPATAKGLRRAMGAFEKLQQGVKKLKTENGWIVMPKNMGDYGVDYSTRAGIALVGLGAIRPHDVVYPTAFIDADGKPLDGANRYVLHFDNGQTPPTNATWSVSMYDPQGFYVTNAINRYNLAMWMPLKYNPDGSLDLYIQAHSPGADKEANWLPAPASGTFNLTVRNYWPTEAVLDGTYKLPPVRKVQ